MSAQNLATPVSDQSRRDRFTLIPPIETYPKFVAFAQTSAGKLVIVAVFGLGLGSYVRSPWEQLLVTVSLGFITFLPRSRRLLVAVGTLAVTAVQSRSLHFLTVVAFGLLLFWCARRWPQSRFGKRPVAFLLVGYTVLILVASAIPKSSGSFLRAWTAVDLIGRYIWFIAYALMDRTASRPNDFALEAGSFHPFWGSTNTPFPKGAAYLRRVEAHDAEQLAVTQLKGLKLLAWALALNILYHAWIFCFHTYLHIPMASEALAMSVKRTPYPWYVCWESQILSFFESLLELSIFGHRIIACCRVAGFNALRNTYRPLSSPTIIEFFNRFYYYFKELLVEFFFYPTFFRYFKRTRWLRLAAATFAAAGFGNMFFHFTRDAWMIPRVGLVKACINFQVFAFYCVVLATALSISQLRPHRLPRADFLRGRLLPALWVVLFYCILDIFGATQRNYPLTEHFRFLGHLFGIHF